MRSLRWLNLCGALFSLAIVFGCAGGGSDSGGQSEVADPVNQQENEEPEAAAAKVKPRKQNPNESGASIDVSKRNVLHVVSLSNNGETSRTVNRPKAESYRKELARKLKGKKRDVRYPALALVSTSRMTALGVNEVLRGARVYMAGELAKDPDAKPSDLLQLEIALSAMMERRYGTVDYFMPILISSKDKMVKASGFTLQGVLDFKEGRTPEAVANWEQALKIRPGFEPAALNLGIVALRFGDFDKAKKLLSRVKADWFVNSHLLVAERLTGKVQTARSICNEVLRKKPKNKIALYNCAVNEFQTYQNYAKAKDYLQKVPKIPSLDSSIDEKAFILLDKIQLELVKRKSGKSRKRGKPSGGGAQKGKATQVKDEP